VDEREIADAAANGADDIFKAARDHLRAPNAPELTGAAKTGPRSISFREIQERYGIPERNQRAFQRVADSRGLTIDVRPTNPSSVRWLDWEASPKPEEVKAKTINQIDTEIGANKENIGLVGFFQPSIHDVTHLPLDEQKAVLSRYLQRSAEFRELASKMSAHETEGKLLIDGGVVYAQDADGELHFVTGDHDLFDIRREDGSRLPENELGQLINELKLNRIAVEHGPHMYWKPTNDFDDQIYHKIVSSHQAGGQPLVRFAPDRPPRLAYANTPVGEV
jgi:hypothetical protein